MDFDFMGKWITVKDFADIKPIDVFHRQSFVSDGLCKDAANRHILFRKSFIINDFKSATIYISADDYYKLYINGEFVSSGPAPCYHFNYYYNVLEVGKFLKKGENVVAVHTYYHGLPSRAYVSGDMRHGLILDIYADNQPVCCSDDSFKVCNHSGYGGTVINHHNTQFTENFDSNSREARFFESDYDDGYWEFATVKENADYTLYSQPTPNLDIYRITPDRIVESKNRILIDNGFEIAGYPLIVAKGKKNSKIIIRYGEELDEYGSVKYHLRCNCFYQDEWVLSGDTDRFDAWDYKGFRYIEILFPDGVEFLCTDIIVRHYPFLQKRACRFEDNKLKAIFELCRNTVKYGIQEVYVDCPTREKGQYFGDAFWTALSQIVLTDDCRLFTKMINDAFGGSFIDKGLMAAGPNSYMQEIAEYPFVIIVACYIHYSITRDADFLNKNYYRCAEVLSYFKDRFSREDGLIGNIDKWNVVDWPANCRDNYDCDLTKGGVCKEFHNVINAYYLWAILSFNKMAAVLGLPQFCDYNKIKNSYLTAFYDFDKKLFKDRENSAHYAIASNVFPLFLEIVPDKYAFDNIISMIKEKKLNCSNCFISQIILLALYKSGKTDLLMDLIKDDGAWLNMLKEGATTTFEAFSKFKKKNCSLFHPVMAFPLLFLTDYNLKNLF